MPRKTKNSTQKYLAIEEIREGIVVLKDGSLRAVLMVSSINFALKSMEEQDAIIFAYQDFINSLDFPLQIVVNSRKLDIAPYLKKVKEMELQQKNELLRIQTTGYIDFIEKLVEMSNIVTKSFYIIIPFAPALAKLGWRHKLQSIVAPKTTWRRSKEDFERYKAQLWQRVDHVASGLKGLGIRMVPLNTQELIELYYSLYNPVTSRNLRLTDINDLQLESNLTISA